ncbi:MAG: hypothetical protein FWE31_00415 [Firmicutes bacterium]|nr:hypothetical protein [Bacillota bacterium]
MSKQTLDLGRESLESMFSSYYYELDPNIQITGMGATSDESFSDAPSREWNLAHMNFAGITEVNGAQQW